jgi:hypothetical protein
MGLARETRLQIMLDENELAAIDDWRFKHRMPSRAAAIRQLIGVGLRAAGADKADPALRSRDFGIFQKDEGEGDPA